MLATEASATRKKPSVAWHSFLFNCIYQCKYAQYQSIRSFLKHRSSKLRVYLKVVFMRTPRICLLKLVSRLSSPLPFWIICPSKISDEFSFMWQSGACIYAYNHLKYLPSFISSNQFKLLLEYSELIWTVLNALYHRLILKSGGTFWAGTFTFPAFTSSCKGWIQSHTFRKAEPAF